MPLPNLGAILTYAQTLEGQAVDFYKAWNQGPAEALARESEKNLKTLARLLRENVTEMILEPIVDFTRAPYEHAVSDPEAMSLEQATAAARDMETNLQSFYQAAAQKLESLPEVGRALQRFAKKRNARLDKLAS